MGKFLLLIIFSCALSASAQNIVLKGKIIDERNKPIDFATVKIPSQDRETYTDNKGQFSFVIDSRNLENIIIKAQMIGKVTAESTISKASFKEPIILILNDLNLNLNEVQVSAIRKETQLSNSSVTLDRQAIEQAQAFSLTDILNNLPGKLYSPLDLQSPKNITLRTAATDNAAQNNALGVAIIIDGIVQSNNANMQNKNLGSYGAGATISDSKNNVGYDVTFGGLDLREIPADNIESIEVISGIAPAQYSDLTDGAIIINRQAGKTDYQFNTRINGSSTNFSLSKGYRLSEKAGFLNMNINYLISNNDPRDNMKKYDRLSGGVMYTKYFGRKIKNTLSLDFSEKLDDAKQDPDDEKDRLTYSKSRKIGIANRTSFEISSKLVKRISLNLGADFGYQDTYSQYYLNGNPKAMANKDTIGVYEGYYIPGNYTAKDQVVGRPKNFNGNISFSSEYNIGGLKHFLSYGANLSISSNGGKGVLYDPDFPRFANVGLKNERPYDFELVPALINTGFYAENRFKIGVFKRDLSLTTGIRYDIQNGYASVQPRLSTNYTIAKNFKFNMAYGIATKAPTMSYRYPGPTYFDIPLINYYTGDVRNSLLLVYTYKYTPDNSKLKPSQSNQFEMGFSYENKFFNSSIYAYSKNNKNGFNTQTSYFAIIVPEYSYSVVNNAKPTYAATGNYIAKTGLSMSEANNGVSSKTEGLELFISTKKIKAIQTSFSLNSSLIKSNFNNSNRQISIARDEDILANKKAWYGLYSALGNKNTSLMSKLNSDTHISRLGLVVSLYYDFVWLQNIKVIGNDRFPIAYLDKFGNYYTIASFDPNNGDYGHLSKLADRASQTKLPFMYGNLSMRIAKELKKKIRFSVNAYNILNLKANYYDESTKQLYNYLEPINIGAEISIKF